MLNPVAFGTLQITEAWLADHSPPGLPAYRPRTSLPPPPPPRPVPMPRPSRPSPSPPRNLPPSSPTTPPTRKIAAFSRQILPPASNTLRIAARPALLLWCGGDVLWQLHTTPSSPPLFGRSDTLVRHESASGGCTHPPEQTRILPAPSSSPPSRLIPSHASPLTRRAIAFGFVVRALARIRRPEGRTTNPKHAKCDCPPLILPPYPQVSSAVLLPVS